jgi:hypothetical protein
VVNNNALYISKQLEDSVCSHHKEVIHVGGEGHSNYPDLIIPQY